MAWPARRSFGFAASAAVLLVCAAQPSRAGEARYCVTCKDPNQVYLCRVNAGGKKPSDALKLYCVIRTAKEGQHRSCSAEKAKGPCNGLVRVYDYDGPMPEDIAAGVQQFQEKLNDRIRKEQKVFEPPKGDQPSTLVELTGRAVSAARSRIGGEPGGEAPPEPPAQLNAAPAPPANAAPPSPAAAPPPSAGGEPNRVQRASSAVGGFARKSYRCMRSLFRDCSDAPAADQTLR
jgi:hypothetical protein